MEPINPPYETTYETRTEQVPIQVNTAFLKEAHGILKIVEIVLTVIIFICVGSDWSFSVKGGGWVNFTASVSLIFSIFFFFVYLFNIIHRLPGPWVIIDFLVQAILCFVFVISMIVSAVYGSYSSSAVASAVFCAFLALVFLIECVLRFSVTRTNGQLFVTTRGTTRVTGGPRFQAAPQEPMPHAETPYPTDSYGMP